MRSRVVMLAAAALALASTVFAITHSTSSQPSASAGARLTLPSRSASYLGVYAAGTPQAYQSVADFATAAGRHPNLVGYYSGWGEAFATSFAQTVQRARGGHDLADGPHLCLCPRDRWPALRQLPALVCRQRPATSATLWSSVSGMR